MPSKSSLIAASAVALSLLMSAGTASAECKTMGFTVNDYGKDGPTKDAKELLDKDIAKWAADNGVDKYTVGKKTVKCELFLDVILFDEHTCTASASVCWGAGVGTNAPAKTAKEGAAPKKSATKAAESEEKPPVETGAITPEAPAEAKVEKSAPAAAEKPAEKPVEAAATPPAAPSSAADESAAERAAAAAERAAAAAERAAAAAEKAASGNQSASTAPDAARQISPDGAAPKP